MLRQAFVMNCAEGFHLRPAQVLAEKASGFQSKITVRRSAGASADAKSILGLMTLGIEPGESVEVEADGTDEKEAVDAIGALFQNNFGE